MFITFLTPPPLDGKRPVERVFGCSYQLYSIPNIFVLTAAAIVEKDGYGVIYTDLSQEGSNCRKFELFLHKDKSDIYCIYSVFLSQNSDLISLTSIRHIRKDVPIIFIGPAPTFDPVKFLQNKNVYVLRGEFEFTLVKLLRKIDTEDLSDIQGLSYVCGTKISHNDSGRLIDDLDVLPCPARHLLSSSKYYNPKLGLKAFTPVSTSRGCPYRCIYCVPCSMSLTRELEYKRNFGCKPPVRFRSVEKVIEEFNMIKRLDFKAVSIIDDLFVLSEERTIEICEGIMDLNIDWGGASRPDHLNEKIIRTMAHAGCKYIDIGIESFSQADLNYIKKDLNVHTIFNAIKLLRKYEIRVKANILLGCTPFQTRESIINNQRIAKKLGIDQVMYNICAPYPGTELYQIAKREKWFIHKDYYPCDVQKEAIVSYPTLKGKELERLAQRANISFFLSPRFIFRNILRISSFRAVCFYFKILVRKLRR